MTTPNDSPRTVGRSVPVSGTGNAVALAEAVDFVVGVEVFEELVDVAVAVAFDVDVAVTVAFDVDVDVDVAVAVAVADGVAD